MKTHLFSISGKIHEKCKKIRPLSKNQRQKMFASCQISYQPKKYSGQKKYSPFNTISRQSRNSYLLKVTNQPNTQTNYQISHDYVLNRERRSTIDQAQFKRIIGPVNQNDYSIPISAKRDDRCVQSFAESSRPKPLTARETHKWRKKYEHLDFAKQINPQRILPDQYLKQMKTTKDYFLIQTLSQTTQSNFNNFKRFSLQPHAQKAHNFKSDQGHKYLQGVQKRQIQPQYDILTNNQQIIKKSMAKPKGQLRFDLFRNKIQTRIDRADPNWLQTLDYSQQLTQQSPLNKKRTSINFNQTLNRLQNQVHSKYPIRQSLKPYVPNNKFN